jgi:hypothetical protein
MNFRSTLTAGVALAVLTLASPASAAVVINYTLDDPDVITEDGNGPANATVHLVADGLYSDNIVYGTVGPTDTQVVITGNEFIRPSTDGNGQPWVIAVDNPDATPGLNSLAFELASGFNFRAIEFNLNTFASTGPPQPWSVDVFSYNGVLLEHATLNGLTNNSFISVSTTNGESLSRVVFNTGGNPQLEGVGQIRIDGVFAVPEPATWAMMILGFGGVGATLRSKRRRALTLA